MSSPAFTIRLRGAPSCYVAREYRCESHGTFSELSSPESEAAPCPECGASAPRGVSAPAVHTQFVVTASQGRSAPKPHARSMDTRPLAEGQTYTSWRKERKKWREEDRHKRVKALLE